MRALHRRLVDRGETCARLRRPPMPSAHRLTASRPPSSAWPSVASSSSFCSANASQRFSSGSSLSPGRGRPARAAASRTARPHALRAAARRSRSSQSSSAGRSVRQMLRPLMTPSDSTLSWRSLGEHRVELVRRRARGRLQAGDRQRAGGIQVVAERAEIGGEHDLQAGRRRGEASHRRVVAPARSASSQVEHQARLVDLHPLGAVGGELGQHLARPAAARRAATAVGRRRCSCRATGRSPARAAPAGS